MQNKFVFLALGISIVFFTACGNGKDAVPTTSTEVVDVAEETEEVIDETGVFFEAIVLDKSSQEGCGFVLQKTNKDGTIQLLEPLTLDDNFKVDGLSVEVRYTLSRRQSLCSLSSVPITIDEIKPK